MKKIYILFLCFSLLVSCSDDNQYTPNPPSTSIINTNNVSEVAQGAKIELKAMIESAIESKFHWKINGETVSSDSILVFSQENIGQYQIGLECINADGFSSSNLTIDVYGKFRDGTFVLNEGNMTTESGSLIFISPEGVVTDSAYFKANGSFLGNVTQDLFITNGKMYIMSQNGNTSATGTTFANDGMLVVVNAETLKKEVSYNEDLTSVLSWPTHVAVLDEEIFIRDNKGIYSFKPSTKDLKLIEGTKGALKNRMAVANNKIFAPASKSVIVLEQNKNAIVHKIEFDAAVSGVIKSADGKLWVSTTGNPAKIMKINPIDYSIIQTNEITEAKVGAGWGASPGISAKGDTLYFSNASTKIYRHVFSTKETTFMVDAKTHVENAGIVYNNLAVHPKTGEVYLNTIKGYGMDYLKNNISIFNFSQSEPKLVENYKDYTNFPAGIFFTNNFK